jgi:YD repeat-containing protein
VGAAVTVSYESDSLGTAVTNSSGSYSIPNLAVATYGVQVQASGYGIGSQSGIAVTAGNTTVVNLSLAGQVQITYTYDELGRLVGVTSPVGGSAAYAYDPVGNILSISTTGAGQLAVLDFTPKSGPVGTPVTITGTAFNGNPLQDTVLVGGSNASVASATTSQLGVTIPATAASGPITVTTPAGSATSAATFTVTTSSAVPSITSFDPTMANAGSGVTIYGTGFQPPINDQLQFNGQDSAVYEATGTSAFAYVPANATSGPITFATPAGSATSGTNFFVIPTGYTSSQVDFTGATTIGGQFTGTINNGGDIGLVLFPATAGQAFSLQITGSAIASGNVSILSPSGSILAQAPVGLGSTSVSSLPAATTGTYTVLYVSAAGDSGTLTFNLSSSSQSTITSGVPQTVSISTGQNAQRSFSGVAGQVVSVQLANSTFPGGCYSLSVSILNPDGSALSSDNWCGQGNFFMNSTTLPTTGTYTLLITPETGATGSIGVTLSVFEQPQGTITPGVPTTMSVTTPGHTAALTFSGTAGQMASFLLNNCALAVIVPGSCDAGLFTILNPDGSTLSSQTIAAGGESLFTPLTLPTTGTYTVIFAPQNGAIGTAQATVWLYSEQVGSVSGSSLAPPIVTINSPQQYMQLTFSGNTGQSVTLNLTNSTFKFANEGAFAYSVGVAILNPDGSTLASTQLGYSMIFAPPSPPTALSIGPTALPSTGTYTVVITPLVGAGVGGLVNPGSADLTLTVQ